MANLAAIPQIKQHLHYRILESIVAKLEADPLTPGLSDFQRRTHSWIIILRCEPEHFGVPWAIAESRIQEGAGLICQEAMHTEQSKH